MSFSSPDTGWRARLPERLPKSLGLLALAGLALIVYAGGLALQEPLQQLDGQQFAERDNPLNAVEMLVYLLVATAGMLALMKLEWDSRFPSLKRLVIAAVKLGVYALIGAWLFVVANIVLPDSLLLLAPLASFGLAGLLAVYPAWWVKNTVAVGVGVLATASWGGEFGLLPALVLLVLLAVYDAIAVYVTGHMKTLASGVLDSDIHLPAVLVVPLRLRPTVDEDHGENEDEAEVEDGSDRERVALGTGDIVIPGVLVVSAAAYAPAPTLHGLGLGMVNAPALAAILGILVGYAGLYRMMARGGAHAGLPWLNGGAIAGYLLGCLASGIPLAVALGLQAPVEVAF